MADFPSPADLDYQIRLAATTRPPAGSQTAPIGTQPLAYRPEFQDWWKGAQQRLFGREYQAPEDPALLSLMRNVVELGRPGFDSSMPVPDSYQASQPSIPFDPLRLIRHGFGDTFLGSLRTWGAIDGAMHFEADPEFDPFTYKPIKESRWAGQWQFFEGARSAKEVDWILGRLDDKQREGEALDRMTGPTAPFQMIGGILGDPLSFLPLSFGAKGAWLAARARTLSAPETAAFGFKPVILGGMNDGLRAMGAQAAIMIGQAAIRDGVDPTYDLENMAELLALPMALAGSAGWALGSYERFSTALNVLKRYHAGDPDFMGPTLPAGRKVPSTIEEFDAAVRRGDSDLRPAILDDLRNALVASKAGQNPVDNAPSRPVTSAKAMANIDWRGQRDISVGGKLVKAADHKAGDTFIDDNGIEWRLQENTLEGDVPKAWKVVSTNEARPATGGRLEDIEFKPGDLPGADPRDEALRPGRLATAYDDIRAAEVAQDGNLSAAATPGSPLHNRAQLIAQARMAPTGIGLENLPLDAVMRAAALPFTSWHGTIEDLVGSAGRIRVKNQRGIPSAQPVEVEINVRWNQPMAQAVRAQQDAFRAYREAAAGVTTPGVPEPSDFQRMAFNTKTAFTDLFNRGSKPLSFEAFRRRVGDALITRDADEIIDAATPFVNKAAAAARKLLDDVKAQADEVGLFRAAYEEQVEKLTARFHEQTRNKGNYSTAAIAETAARLKKAQKLLDELVANGPGLNTAPSFRPRYWLVAELQKREDEFKQIVTDFYRTQHKAPVDEAKKIAQSVYEILSRTRHYTTKENIDDLMGKVANPMSAMARTFEIPDRLVKDFLENDAETIIRAHTRSMGTSIELMRRFGSTGLEAEAKEIMDEAKMLIDRAVRAEDKAAIRKQAKLAITDLEAMRDRLHGTYGAAKDPHTWDNRLIRMAKQFSNLTLLGGAGITALADLIRPAMTEGLQAMNHYGFKTLASESRATILKMSRKELEAAGDALELINNVRALSASDTGDLMHSRTRFERGLNQTNQYFFVANGLNAINQLDKEWGGLIIQGNMNDLAMKVAKGKPIPKEELARFAAAGLDEPMLKRIGDELLQHKIDFKSITMANSDAWTDELARGHYRNALNQFVNRTVPTPGMGDRANWTSSPLGGLISQYKAFAMGAMSRVLISGLQEGGAKFWYGATMATGLAIILNEVRSRLFYDRSTFDRPMTAVIADGIERSSVLGWFGDVNRAIETLSGHRAGVKPWLGADRPRTDSTARQVGTILGPSIGQGFNAGRVLTDFLSGHPTVRTWAEARRLVPGNTLPYLDPVFDHAISDGSFHKNVRDVARVNRQ